MTTATQERIARILACDGNISMMRNTIHLVLMEQNDETRRACAEAVLALPGDTIEGYRDPVITGVQAHAACINVQAI